MLYNMFTLTEFDLHKLDQSNQFVLSLAMYVIYHLISFIVLFCLNIFFFSESFAIHCDFYFNFFLRTVSKIFFLFIFCIHIINLITNPPPPNLIKLKFK